MTPLAIDDISRAALLSVVLKRRAQEAASSAVGDDLVRSRGVPFLYTSTCGCVLCWVVQACSCSPPDTHMASERPAAKLPPTGCPRHTTGAKLCLLDVP